MKSKILALSKNEEFKKLLKKKKISNKYVTIFFGRLDNKNNKRLNISFVAKKKIGNAIKRNKIKRRLRNIMNDAIKKISIKLDYSYLVISQPAMLNSEFKNIKEIKPEMKFGTNTRFDFLIINKKYKAFVEVKNVTLSRKKKLAEFPDTVTARGLKHINELIKASKKGFKVYILYLIQREDCNSFAVAKDIDQNYTIALLKAVKNNLKILCYDCKFSSKGIKLNNQIKFKK